MEGEQETAVREDELEIDLTPWSKRREMGEAMHMMISHHPPSLFGHCLRLTFRGRSLYMCARCTGIYGGLFVGLAVLFLSRAVLTPSWLWFLFSLAIGFSTVFDWVTQRLTPRKTTVRVRAITGLLSGISLAIIFYLADLFYMLVALVVMGVTVTGVSILETRRNKKPMSEMVENDDE
ncbi:MAG: DUF2085 domain-containing protein [Candidatus Thorarchaeota archaeon]